MGWNDKIADLIFDQQLLKFQALDASQSRDAGPRAPNQGLGVEPGGHSLLAGDHENDRRKTRSPLPRLRIRLASLHEAIGLTKSVDNAAQLPSFGALSSERPLSIA